MEAHAVTSVLATCSVFWTLSDWQRVLTWRIFVWPIRWSALTLKMAVSNQEHVTAEDITTICG